MGACCGLLFDWNNCRTDSAANFYSCFSGRPHSFCCFLLVVQLNLKGCVNVKVVVLQLPKFLTGILKGIFKIK